MKKKMKIKNLKVNSFVTGEESLNANTINGGGARSTANKACQQTLVYECQTYDICFTQRVDICGH
ncbi:MAG: pinensin family lanthipeptide [Cyclobacteriaceae bacterium]